MEKNRNAYQIERKGHYIESKNVLAVSKRSLNEVFHFQSSELSESKNQVSSLVEGSHANQKLGELITTGTVPFSQYNLSKFLPYVPIGT